MYMHVLNTTIYNSRHCAHENYANHNRNYNKFNKFMYEN